LNASRIRRFSLTRHKWSLLALPAFGLLLIAAVWGGIWLQLQSMQSELLVGLARDTESVAASFEEFTLRAIRAADRAARLVKHEFEEDGTVDLSHLVAAGLIDAGADVVVNVTDAKGIVTARSVPTGPFSVADRDFFLFHAQRDSGLLDISRPIQSRVSGRSTIVLSRRLNHRDLSFAGVVAVAVSPDYFTDFYKNIELGEHGSLSLLGLDGAYRARRVGDDTAAIEDGSGAPLIVRALESGAGYFEGRGEVDRIKRVTAYRKMPGFPFVVTAGKATDEALSDFYLHRRNYILIALAASLAIAVFFGIVTVLAFRLQRNRAQLKVQRRFLETLVDNFPAGITVRSMQPGKVGRYVLWNESNALIFGTKPAEALGKTVEDIMLPQYSAEILEFDRKLLASPMIQDIEQERDVPGRGRRIYHLIRSPIFGESGQVDYIMTTATDITEERAHADELTLAARVFETTADAIVLSDADDRVITVNAAFTKLTGFDASDIVGLILAESPFRPIDVEESRLRMETQQREGFVTGEVPRFRKDGTALSLWVTASSVRNADGTIRNHVRVFTDISLLKEAQQKLEQLASFDTLTGLPNRRLLLDRLEQAVLRAQRSNQGLAVMFIDLDGFKIVNDTLGHDAGDLVLREVALRLAKCIRLSDSVARLGGDEFAVVLEKAQIPEDAAHVGERIVANLALPFVIDGQLITIAASIGIAIYPNDGTDGATLLKHADAAMYGAKQAGRNRFKFFSPTAEDAVDVA
jgi:diguanylate cyclase